MPRTIVHQQAAAAIGQSHLIWTNERLFGAFHQKVAQILLTHEDLRSRTRYLNARNTLLTLLQYGVIPIINEMTRCRSRKSASGTTTRCLPWCVTSWTPIC